MEIKTNADLKEVSDKISSLKSEDVAIARNASIFITKEHVESGRLKEAKESFEFVRSWHDDKDEDTRKLLEEWGKLINDLQESQGKEFHSIGDKVDKLIKSKSWKEARENLKLMFGLRPDDKGAKAKEEQIKKGETPKVAHETYISRSRRPKKPKEVTIADINAKVSQANELALKYIAQESAKGKNPRRVIYAKNTLTRMIKRQLVT